MPRKIAIVGACPDTRMDAPWDDPSWEIWGLSRQFNWMKRWDRWFELHSLESRRQQNPDYIPWLASQPCPVYLQATTPEIPQGIAYPKERVLNELGDYLTNTIALEIALAILEGVDEIGIWGVNMAADEEYGYQRPSCEYWVGLARGRGIKVSICKGADLCKARGLYGFDANLGEFATKVSLRRKELSDRIAYHQDELHRAKLAWHLALGIYQEAKRIGESINGEAPELKADLAARCESSLTKMQELEGVQNENHTHINRITGALEDTNYWSQWS